MDRDYLATILEIISVILLSDSPLIITLKILILLIKFVKGALTNDADNCWKKPIGKAFINNNATCAISIPLNTPNASPKILSVASISLNAYKSLITLDNNTNKILNKIEEVKNKGFKINLI